MVCNFQKNLKFKIFKTYITSIVKIESHPDFGENSRLMACNYRWLELAYRSILCYHLPTHGLHAILVIIWASH